MDPFGEGRPLCRGGEPGEEAEGLHAVVQKDGQDGESFQPVDPVYVFSTADVHGIMV